MMLCRSLGMILAVLWLCVPTAAAMDEAPPLKILRITPEGKEVPAGRQIVIEFDRPVVPLGRMERTAAELPITVTPELECQWRWLNPSALACQLGEEQHLAPATTYRLAVAPGIRTQQGGTLAGTVRHTFTTLRPAVENAWFQTWRSPGTPVLLVTFNQPVVRGEVARHLYLRQVKGERRRFGLSVEPHPDDQEPPMTVGADEARTRWQVSPLKELPLETAVGLNVEPGLISAQGPEAGIETREVVRFDTFPPFRLIGLSCTANAGKEVTITPGKPLESQPLCSPTDSIQLLFNAPVGLDKVKAHLRVNPGFAAGPEGGDPWDSAVTYGNLDSPHEKGQTYGVYLPQAWRARQTYDLTVAADLLKDDFDRPLTQPVKLRFATDQMRPDYYLMHNPAVLEAQVDTQVPLFVTNLDEITLTYDRMTTAGVERKLSRRLSLPAEKDVTVPIPLGVRDMLGNRSGAVTGTITTRPKIEDDEWKRTFFAQVSPYQVHVKLGHFGTLVWVTDLATGAPVPSALVRIYKEAPDVLAEAPGSDASTSDQGIALLPGTKELDPKLEALGWCEEESKCRRLFVRVTKDDQMALLPLDDNFLVDTYRASGGSLSDAMQRDYGHMQAWGTTAQGVYRAGETIQYKFYVRNQDNTRLTAPPLSGYSVEIIDPTGKTVHTVKEIKLSAFGAYDGEFAIPKNGAVGWYHFKLSAAFTETTWRPMRVLVSDFTPSPFRARVELNGTLFRPGDPLQITSTAALHSGGPYPDAPLRVVARVAEAVFSSEHPVARGFNFYDDTQRNDRILPVYEGEETLDDQGIALLPGTQALDPKLEALGWCDEERPCRRLFVRVTKDDQMALLPLDDNFLVDTYRASGASISDAMQRDYGHMQAWGTTAQGVHRAGETIQYKFYVRNQDNTRLTPPPLEGYSLEIIDPTGKTVHTLKEIKLSTFGAYDGEFAIPKNGAVGWYHFKLSAAFTETNWRPMRVLVSDFTPSPFRARVELNGTLFRPGDPLQITSTAALHSGGPYPDAPLRVVARVAEANFSSEHPVAQGFNFYDDTQRNDRILPVYEGEETLDDQGKQVADLTVPEGELLYGRLLAESAVQDDRGKYVAATASATFVGRDRFVGLQQTRWVYAAGEPAQIRFIVTDEKGSPVAGDQVALTVERQETVASRVKGAGSAYLTQYTHSWVAVTDQHATAAEAPGLFTFTPQTPGYYRVTAAIQDTRQRPVRTQTYAYVAGKGQVLWEAPDDNSLQLIPEKEKLQVGDTGRFLVKNPYPGAQALISVERYGVMRHWVQTLEGSTPIIEVPVTADDLPGFYLSVLVTSPRVERADADGQVDLGKPGLRMGYRRVTVEDPAKQIRVELRPDRQTYKPGEKVRVALQAIAPRTAGAAEPMELAVAVLDEAVLDLNNQGRDYYDPYKGFYQLEPLDLQNYSLLTRLVGRQKFEKKGAAGPGDGGSDIGMRSLFKYVSYWNPSLAVDADGRAEIVFEAPDNLTGWRILAMAVTPSDRMGLGDATVQVNRATEIRPVMPNQVLQGDRFQAGFSVMNRTEKARRITVTIQAAGPLAEAAGKTTHSQAIELPAFKRETVWMPVATQGAGSLTFTVTARDEGDADGLIHILPVRQRQALDTAASHGSFDAAAAVETLQFPEKIHTDAGGVELLLAPTVIGNLDGAFDYMRTYPYGCWEQRLSRAVMAAHFQRLRAYLPAKAAWEGAEAVPAQTLAEAAEFQAPNGGMSYYRPQDAYVCPYLSAYTALAFTWLRADGYAIPEAVEKPLLAYLENLLKKEAVPDFYSKGMAATVRAVALAALADHGLPAADLARYRDHMPQMSLFGLAHFLQAALKTEGGEKTAAEAFKRLMAHSHQSSGQALFTETLDSGFARMLSSSARTQAAILSALTAYGTTPQGAGQVGDLPMRLTRAITLERGARTHWANTQENIFGLKALVDYSAVYEKESPAMTVKALLDGQPLGETAFQDRRAEAVTFSRPIAADDPGKQAEFSIQRQGTGRLYYTARLRYAPLEATDPVNAGIEIRREYSVLRDGRWVLLTTPMQIRRAELVRVDLFLSLPAARHFVVVDDAVPGGLEPVNRDLATASGIDADQTEYTAADGSWWFHFSDWRGYESSRWSFHHQELRHDSARFYSDYLPAGNYHLVYTAQAIAAGEFTVSPVYAEEMYDPDLYGRGTPAVLRIEEVKR